MRFTEIDKLIMFKRTTLLFLTLLVSKTLSESPVEPLHPSLVGAESTVLYDKISDLGPDNINPDFPLATKVRSYKVKFKYNQAQTDNEFIYYEIFQLLNKEHEVITEKAKFSWNEMGPFKALPTGCPPPIISPPEKPDPCQMGYSVGKVISKTIANVVVPQLLEDNPNNPFSEDPLFQEIKKIEEEISTNKDTQLNDK